MREFPRRPALTPAVARRVYWRCLALQASWNDQRMQNLGLVTALAPWLRGQSLDRDRLRRALRRYYGYFNTNPYLAPYVIGGLLRLEHDRAAGAAVSERLVTGVRDTLARACGALGDQLFWLGLRPAVMLLGCLLALLGAWPGVLVVVGLVAAAQLVMRWRALDLGFGLGPEVIDVLGRPGWHRAIAWARRLALALTGSLIGLYFAGILAPGGPVGEGRPLVSALAGLALPFFVRQRASGEVQLLLGLPVVAAVALLL
jgi:PTS system mannose-specific IID component